MEPFEFKIDTSTKWMKALNALGFILLGFTISSVMFSYKFGEPIEWMHIFTSVLLGLVLGIFPGRAKLPELYIDKSGISVKNYTFDRTEQKEITWDKISEIRVDRNKIYIKRTIGSSERIKLPIYTKEQVQGLKAYLQNIAPKKEVKYLG